MNKIIKLLLAFFLALSIVKMVLAALIPSPTIFADEYMYAKLARSFFLTQTFSVHGNLVNYYPPLYPMIISIAYTLKNMKLVYLSMKIINALISSLIIFPAFFLAREKLSNKDSLLAAALVSFFPANFAFSQFILSENLFYPLFLASFYFLYKAIKEKKLHWNLLAGIFIGLAILTRFIGILLLILAIVMYLISILKKNKPAVSSFLVFIIPAIFYGLWFIRNLLLFGMTEQGVLGPYGSITRAGFTFLPFFVWLGIYFAYILLAGGIILPLTFFASKKKNILWYMTAILMVITIIFLAERAVVSVIKAETLLAGLAGRPIGRYADIALLPLIITGFIALRQKTYKKFKLPILISIIALIAGSQLIFFSLFPANNISLTIFGIISILINKLNLNIVLQASLFALVCLSLLFAGYFIVKKSNLTTRKIAMLVLLFFLATSLLAYGISYYNATSNWNNTEQAQLGRWFNDIDKGQSKVLFDIRDCEGRDLRLSGIMCAERHYSSTIGFWMNNELIIADPSEGPYDSTYIISKHELEFEKIKELSAIKVYRVK